MNNTGTCPDIDSDFLKHPTQLTKSREFIRELALLAIMHGHGHDDGPWMMELGRFHTKLASR